ncbi:membrane-bound lytic murein transglycosylase MltF [Marinobacter sp.]|uniref:membrane-bound lytic murein transglycosylase MltF n=1 Tax=Marinobacter sp. TaxID=50741 RepID=UPI00345BA558
MPKNRRQPYTAIAKYTCLLSIILTVAGCSRPSTLQEIRSEGVLHIITRNAPSVYFEGRDGPTGYDYELARLFAEDLGVELKVRVAKDNTSVLSILDQDYAHIGLAGLSSRPDFQQRYQKVANGIEAESVVVYNREVDRPDSLEDLEGQTIHLVADSNHEHQLEQFSANNSGLQWTMHAGLDAAGILSRVESGEFPLAIVSSNELELNHVFFPMVKSAFSLGEAEPLLWLFPNEQDQSLANAAEQFIHKLREDGTLAHISERFYGHLDRLDYVGARTFVHHVENRLPKYESLFRDYATTYDLDWRLLAAMGYQESHWRPNAVSPTGVRGLMMLTRNTASHIGINNRLDAEESIQGGAKYFTIVHSRVPDRIPEPDRTWFALASYNVGWGHVEDARRLTEGAGRNPDRWMDVKEFLPLLAQKEWYSKTRFGYARGHEPVIYVQNIRRYYDFLAWLTEPTEVAESEEKPWFKELEGMEKIVGPDNGEGNNSDIRASLPEELGFVPPTL